jgi:hypothetical protein
MGSTEPFKRNRREHRRWPNRSRRKRNEDKVYPFVVGGMTLVAIYAAMNIDLREKSVPGAYYPNCAAARAAGVAPIYAGEPGYREELDGDGDGIACEPYRG